MGDESKAYRYLKRAAFIDLTDLQKIQEKESMRPTPAVCGRLWCSVFAGVSLEEDGVIDIRPHMPKEWKGLSFKLHHRGSRLEIAVSPDNRVTVTVLEGGPVTVRMNGKVVILGRTKNCGRRTVMKKYLAIFGPILVTVIWGGGFVASDMALDSLTPFQIMTFRFFWEP